MENRKKGMEQMQSIQDMLKQTAAVMERRWGKHYLFWAYLACLTSLTHFLLTYFKIQTIQGATLWYGALAIGAVVSLVLNYRDKQTIEKNSFSDILLLKTWFGFCLSLILAVYLLNSLTIWFIYPIATLLFTFTLYISSIAYRQYWFYAVVCISFIITLSYRGAEIHYYPLIMAVAMAVGGIIPGHILNCKAKRQNFM